MICFIRLGVMVTDCLLRWNNYMICLEIRHYKTLETNTIIIMGCEFLKSEILTAYQINIGNIPIQTIFHKENVFVVK